jgi:flagellar assembly protein FliH
MTLLKQASLKDRNAGRFAFRHAAANEAQLAEHASTTGEQQAAYPDNQLAQLQATVQRLTEQLASAEARAEEARQDGISEGYKSGLADAVCREEERLALLGQGLRESLEHFAAKLLTERDVAIELAVATIEAVLGDASERSSLVASTASRWASDLKESGLVNVRVSAEDFSDDESIARLCGQLGQVNVTADSSLTSGSCLLDLELGYVDASLPVQADAARTFLLQHAKAGGAQQ